MSKEEESLSLDTTDICIKHGAKYVVYCRQCSELLCCTCMVDSFHKEHVQRTCPLEVLFTEMLSTIQKQGHLVQKEEMATQASIKEMEARREHVDEILTYTREDIEEFFASVQQFIDGHKAHISDAIKRSKEDELQKLQSKERELVEQIQKCEELNCTTESFLQRLMENDVSVLAEVEQVLANVDKLESSTKSFDSGPPQGFNQPSMVTIDLATTKEKVKQIVDKLGGCQSPSFEMSFLQDSEQTELILRKKPKVIRNNLLSTRESNPDTLMVSSGLTRAHCSDPSESQHDIPQGKSDQEQRPLSCFVEGTNPKIFLPYLAMPETIIPCPGCDPYSVCFARNRSIATSDKNSGSIYVFKQDGKCSKKTVKKEEASGLYLTFYADKQKIISVGPSNDGNCRMFKLKTEFGKVITLPNVSHPGGVTIACDPRPIVVVTDHKRGGIYKFSTDGQFQCEIDTTEFDLAAKPMGIDYAHGNMVVVDQGMHCIIKLSMAGRIQWKAGRRGSGNGCLSHPFDVAVARNGHVVVTDTGNHRIAVFDRNGTFVLCFGRMGTGPGTFISPRGITVIEGDSIVVADSGNHRLQIFSLEEVLRKDM